MSGTAYIAIRNRVTALSSKRSETDPVYQRFLTDRSERVGQSCLSSRARGNDDRGGLVAFWKAAVSSPRTTWIALGPASTLIDNGAAPRRDTRAMRGDGHDGDRARTVQSLALAPAGRRLAPAVRS